MLKPQADPDFWWTNSPHFDLQKGHAVAKAGDQAGFDWYWKPRNFAAWTYEIVRRLPNMKHNSNEITPEDLSALISLPPYPSLTPKQHSWLESIMYGTS